MGKFFKVSRETSFVTQCTDNLQKGISCANFILMANVLSHLATFCLGAKRQWVVHFKVNDAQCVNVNLLPITFLLHLLWAYVQTCSNIVTLL